MSQTGSTKVEFYGTIVIGAGMSGLACASKLLDHQTHQEKTSTKSKSTKKLLVLEARDRIGGRIGSLRVNGNRLDTGANWIHGIGSKDSEEGENPLVNILPNKGFKELNCSVSFRTPSAGKSCAEGNEEVDALAGKTIIESAADYEWTRVDASNAPRKRSEPADLVIPSEISGRLFQALWTLIGSVHQRSQEVSAEVAKDASILKVILEDERFRKTFDELPQEYHASLAALPQFIENMEAGPLDTSISPTIYSPSAGLGLLEYAIGDFDGDQVFLRDGYTAVVEEVGKKVIEQGHVKLSVEVEHIKWDDKLIEVSTKAGMFSAKRVICTLPLGILQHNLTITRQSHNKPFISPPLPSSYTEAIHSLGFGTLDKIFLVYSQPWWKDEPWKSILRKGFTFQPLPGHDDDNLTESIDEPDSFWGFTAELPGISIPPAGDKAVPGARALSLINLHSLTGYPVLSCFVSCANALHMEGLSDAAAGELIHRALGQWLGQEPPTPDAVHVTRWAQDEFSRGSYTHMIAGLSERKHREIFGKPIVNKYGAELRFAGEHTSEDHFATVHGALLSGWREADAVLKSEAETAA